MKEVSVEKRLIKLVKDAGGICFKIMPIVAGLPDRCVILPPGRIFLIETKAPGGALRPAQRVWHARAAAVGVKVHVLNSSKEVEDWMRDNEV